MVINPTLEPKEEGPGIPNRKSMENTVNQKTEENPRLTSKLTETSSESDLPPQTVVTWMMVSVAVSFLSVYTMVDWVANKLAQEIENRKIAEEQINEQSKNTTDDFSQSSNEQIFNDFSEENIAPEDALSTEKSDFNTLQEKPKVIGEERQEELDVNGKPSTVECEQCLGNVAVIQMGPGFAGNLCISSDASAKCEELAGTKPLGSTSKRRNLESTAINNTNCQSTAELQNCDLNQDNPVTVNNLRAKCLTCHTEKSRNGGAGLTLPLQGFGTSNFDLLCAQQSSISENKDTTKTASPSLNYLANYHTSQETTDGSFLSKDPDDAFMFPQDNEMATVDSFKQETDLETPRARFQRMIREDPALSKSLDSQIETLRKGCKLLEKQPLKSSLKTSGSDSCLKKFVHFPEDIRNIRTVHKYQSFDETWPPDFHGEDKTGEEKQKA